jgi:hypothetical protein
VYKLTNNKRTFILSQKDLSSWIQTHCFHPTTGMYLYKQVCITSLKAGTITNYYLIFFNTYLNYSF